MMKSVLFSLLLAASILAVEPSRGHDHERPELNKWFEGLQSKMGRCCDGTEALHLSDVDWETQNKPHSHYRVKVPVNSHDYEAALKGAKVGTGWVDVPDDALIEEPNREGTALVWPYYISGGGFAVIRCFMPGVET